jgi:hypothetical protein
LGKIDLPLTSDNSPKLALLVASSAKIRGAHLFF